MQRRIGFLALLLGLLLQSAAVLAQSKLYGSYTTVGIQKPKTLPSPATSVTLVPDQRQKQVVWIKNLLPGGPIRAVREGESLGIPAQQVGSYKINFGCALLQEEQLLISLNNKNDCPDIDDVKVSASSRGITAPGVKVGPGGISVPGVKVGGGEVTTNTKGLFPGVQYIGRKVGADND